MNALKSWGRTAGYWVLRGVLGLMPVLPMSVVQFLGRRLGDLMRIASKRRRAITDRNLRIAFGDGIAAGERDRIARASFREFGVFALECMKFATMSDESIETLVDVEPETARRARELLDAGRGVIFVSAHFGNFELAARWLAMHGHEVLVVVRAARDARTTELMNRLRARNGMTTIRRDLAGRPMLAALRKGGCVAILADQNADDVFVPFFGQPTGTVDGPAKLALHTGSPILVGMCERCDHGRYRLRVEGIVEPDPKGERVAEIARISALLNGYIEAAIRRRPEQWLWCHNRWRSSPDVRV
ncbi:MAG: lipid A biosynthesis acyltransferase [Armatimonadetes bacterium]|nr:lipid A biosynthesis acyltransferase [Armatimonadota bacterium]